MKVKYLKEGKLRRERGPPVHGGWAPKFGSLSRHCTGLSADVNIRQWCSIPTWTAVGQERPHRAQSKKGVPGAKVSPYALSFGWPWTQLLNLPPTPLVNLDIKAVV